MLRFMMLPLVSLFIFSKTSSAQIDNDPEDSNLRAIYTCNSMIMEIKLIDTTGNIVGRTIETFSQSSECLQQQGTLNRSRGRISENTLIAVCNGWKLRTIQIIPPGTFKVVDDSFANSYQDCLQQANAINGSFSQSCRPKKNPNILDS